MTTFQPTKPPKEESPASNDIWKNGKQLRTISCSFLFVNIFLVLSWLVLFGFSDFEQVENGFDLLFEIGKFGFGLGAIFFGSIVFFFLGTLGAITAGIAIAQSNKGKPVLFAIATFILHVIMISILLITIMSG